MRRYRSSILALAFILLVAVTTSALAQQRVTVKPDGRVSMSASAAGVTRIAVTGDRIVDMVTNPSTAGQLEVKFDEQTGAAFVRFVDPARARPDAGFLVTESGVTLTYAMKPDTRSDTEAVLITVEKPAAAVASEPEIAFATRTGGGGVGGSGGYAGGLVAFARDVFAAHVEGKAVPNRRSGTVIKTVKRDGMIARVIVVSAGATGGAVRPQALHRACCTLAVFIDKPVLAPNQRSFAIEIGRGN